MKPSERICEIIRERTAEFVREWPHAPVPDFRASSIERYLDEEHERQESAPTADGYGCFVEVLPIQIVVHGLDKLPEEQARQVVNGLSRELMAILHGTGTMTRVVE